MPSGVVSDCTGNYAELESLISRILQLNPKSDRALELLALRTFWLEDAAVQQQVRADLCGASE